LKRTTSITESQFEQLTKMMWQELLGATDGGRVVVLTQRDQVRLALTYLRANVTQAFLGEMFGVSQATASRVITTMTPILARLLKDFVPDPEAASKGTTLLVDGSLTPCWSWKDAPELYSGKHKTTGHNVQVVSDLRGQLVYLSAPLPGKTHDAEAFRQLDLATVLTSIGNGNTVGDKGYQRATRDARSSARPGNCQAPNSATTARPITRSSTDSARPSNALSPTSRPGESCIPTTADPEKHSKRLSTRSAG